MANRKITDLPELLTPANDDWLYIVDKSDLTESAEGTSKKIKKNNVIGLGAGELQFIDYPKITVANTQNFLVPDGAIVKMVFNNKTQYFQETANNAYQVDTFTQSGNIITLKKPTVVGNYISAFYQ